MTSKPTTATNNNSCLPNIIFLTGYMGAGKSTVGRLLAKTLGYQFIDTDKQLTTEYDLSMTEIFKQHGEPAFRKAELELLERLSKQNKIVISVGGGTLVREETWTVAANTGIIVYLQAPVGLLFERVIFSPKDRPMINVPNAEAQFKKRFAEREPFYKRSHYTVASSVSHPEGVVEEIMVNIEEDKHHEPSV